MKIATKEFNKVLRAKSFYSRLKGLMGSKALKNDEVMVIYECNSIHTFFMKFPLDVVFLSKDNEVVKIIKNIKPWRMTKMYWKANKVLELTAGALPQNLQEGDRIEGV